MTKHCYRIGDMFYVNRSVKGTIVKYLKHRHYVLEFVGHDGTRTWYNNWAEDSLKRQKYLGHEGFLLDEDLFEL